MASNVTTPRVVPGAPPPIALSKSQRKKKKSKAKGGEDDADQVSIPDPTSAALVEKAPEPAEINAGAVAPQLVAQPSEEPETTDPKLSPIVDLISKRLKATGKKITRIQGYSSNLEELNEDQKRAVNTLPVLEAVQKELAEVKKAVEVQELELAHDLRAKRAETERAALEKIANAVTTAQAASLAHFSSILNIIRLRQMGSPALEPAEATALEGLVDTLLAGESAAKQAALRGLTSGYGDFNGFAYARIFEITRAAFSSTPAGPSTDEEPIGLDESAPPASTAPVFINPSEIEAEAPLDASVEWVKVASQEEHPEAGNGSIHPEGTGEGTTDTSGVIDWAADDHAELPSIAGLQAQFGTSGTATPVTQEEGEPVEGDVFTNGNGGAPAEEAAEDDDGFQTAGGSKRARGRGGFRGGDRGFRGGGRGGRGFRGGRGGDRGGDRGSFRGHRGDGSRGRGGPRGSGRGGPPPS